MIKLVLLPLVTFPDRQIEGKPLYTGELGLNIPLHPVSIQINVRLSEVKKKNIRNIPCF